MIIGDILAYAGMLCGYKTSFYSSYGVEMRGGIANCMVVITSGELYSPKSANMVMLGAFVGVKNAVPLEKVEEAIRLYSSGKENLVDDNINALKEGLNWAYKVKSEGK